MLDHDILTRVMLTVIRYVFFHEVHYGIAQICTVLSEAKWRKKDKAVTHFKLYCIPSYGEIFSLRMVF
jgi:hypothetical protein